jgi:hypothetical protein
MKEERLTRAQVLARMKRGDLPQMVGAGGFVAVFDDGAKAGHQTMRGLEKSGFIERPVGTSISARWTLAPPPRFVVQSVRYFGIGRKPSTPHAVVDTTTNETVDEYKSKRAAAMDARDRNEAARVQQVNDVRLRLDARRSEARDGVRLEAESAGLDEDTVAACVDAAMSAYEDVHHDEEAWEDLVASVIQGHAAP